MSNYERLYRVQFTQNDLEHEVYVQQVDDSALLGFIELSDFVSDYPVDEDIQQGDLIQKDLKHVTQMLIPMHAVLRIDVLKTTSSTEMRPDNIHPFPAKKPASTPSE